MKRYFVNLTKSIDSDEHGEHMISGVCNKCYDAVMQQYNSATAELWVATCELFIRYNGIYRHKESRVPWLIGDMRNLEEMGFISSCDELDAVLIRANGMNIEDYQDERKVVFCNDSMSHRSDWAHENTVGNP
jgi:hypothetical protein